MIYPWTLNKELANRVLEMIQDNGCKVTLKSVDGTDEFRIVDSNGNDFEIFDDGDGRYHYYDDSTHDDDDDEGFSLGLNRFVIGAQKGAED